ncbi:MAG: D-glycero-beta-D-manno-heptose 1,7-bisphosphate 7-phosphatase [Desulfarculaceae bacterium]|nr:D-glycero-beta-D-manno-heptose 1,7-bisphosphate 7-phosphatase [Desulfarculaceae bacterium]
MGYTVFLDRDGVINRDSSAYVKSPSEFVFIEKSPEAVALLTRHGFDVFVITNQSVIGREMTTPQDLNRIFTKMTDGISAKGGCIRDIFYCPHTPDAGCSCRKPLPGLIHKARNAYDINLGQSCMVGDSAKDIECAKNAGCGASVLVQTGNGEQAGKVLETKSIHPDFVARDLYAAACWIVKSLS